MAAANGAHSGRAVEKILVERVTARAIFCVGLTVTHDNSSF
jgi:hypothetical protein